TGHDLRAEAVGRLVEHGGEAADGPAAAARGRRLLIVMVVTDAQAEAVLFGGGDAAAALAAGATVVLSATVPPAFARDLGRRLGERGLHLLDAPVSGGAVGAEGGTLTIMASGSPAAFEAAGPALEACARKVYRLGDEPGIGSTVKMINQLMAGVNLVTACEGMAFGAKCGADPRVLFEIVSESAGGSWMLGNRGPHMLEGDFTPPRSTVDIWTKDLGIVLETAKAMKLPLPMTATAFQVAMMAVAQGLAKIDDAGIVKVYEAFGGMTVGPRRDDS
ncbi:MAG TPA: NAD-binding protein, partial [Geminicoccaceae bacterium]|nr:NAD-binding protein [Geminicoccaceae bacterium]